MLFVTRLLWLKIIGTALAAAFPMLLAPEWIYLSLGFPEQPTMLFVRLYGLSTLALLFGYYSGIEQVRRGQIPTGILRMGLVSNGGQGAAIVMAGAFGTFSTWGVLAQVMMWSLAAFILSIAMAILTVLLRRERPETS